MNTLMLDSLVGNDYSLCLCDGLTKAGIAVTLAVPKDKETNTVYDFKVLKWSPSKSGDLSRLAKGKDYLVYLVRVFGAIKKSNVEIVHFQFFRRKYIDTLFSLVLKLSGVKLVYTAHNVLPHENNYSDRVLNALVLRIMDSIIVHSEYIKNKVLNVFSISSEKVHVVPHGNFDIYLSGSPISKHEARTQLGINDHDNVVLFFGYIREYKGLDLALEAFDKACIERQDLKLVIAGAPHNDEIRKKYLDLIEKMNFKERVVYEFDFIAFENVAKYFTASDLVLLPYRKIDHSGIIHLAYSFGRPVIATQVGDFAEVIADGKSGYLVNRDDPDDMARAIVAAFSTKNWLAESGAHAKWMSENQFSWESIGAETRKVYEELL